ncbi:MAG: hypothetical protein DRI70_03955, partial [Bacteroidetes bacterium]
MYFCLRSQKLFFDQRSLDEFDSEGVLLQNQKTKTMAFDIDMIKKVYAQMPERVDRARQIVGRPLTLSEKILYSHLW